MNLCQKTPGHCYKHREPSQFLILVGVSTTIFSIWSLRHIHKKLTIEFQCSLSLRQQGSNGHLQTPWELCKDLKWSKNLDASLQMSDAFYWGSSSWWPSMKVTQHLAKGIQCFSIISYICRFSTKFAKVHADSAGTNIMLMQTGWIQARPRVTRRLAWDPTSLLRSESIIPHQN